MFLFVLLVFTVYIELTDELLPCGNVLPTPCVTRTACWPSRVSADGDA